MPIQMKEREEKEKAEKLEALEIRHAKMEADYIHLEKERKKKLKKLEEGGCMQSFLTDQIVSFIHIGKYVSIFLPSI